MARQRAGEDPIRARLVAAAQRVLTRDGLAAVTVRKVAAEAGLSVGVLYNHFEDSDDLLAAALAAQMSAAGASLPAQSKGDIVMFAQALLDQIRHNLPFATTLIDRPALQAKLMEHAGGFDTPRLGGEVTAALLAAQGSGEVNAEADVEGVVLGVHDARPRRRPDGAVGWPADHAGMAGPPADSVHHCLEHEGLVVSPCRAAGPGSRRWWRFRRAWGRRARCCGGASRRRDRSWRRWPGRRGSRGRGRACGRFDACARRDAGEHDLGDAQYLQEGVGVRCRGTRCAGPLGDQLVGRLDVELVDEVGEARPGAVPVRRAARYVPARVR